MVLEAAEDTQGTVKNRVVKVKPPRKTRSEAAETIEKHNSSKPDPNRLAV